MGTVAATPSLPGRQVTGTVVRVGTEPAPRGHSADAVAKGHQTVTVRTSQVLLPAQRASDASASRRLLSTESPRPSRLPPSSELIGSAARDLPPELWPGAGETRSFLQGLSVTAAGVARRIWGLCHGGGRGPEAPAQIPSPALPLCPHGPTCQHQGLPPPDPASGHSLPASHGAAPANAPDKEPPTRVLSACLSRGHHLGARHTAVPTSLTLTRSQVQIGLQPSLH